MNGPPFEGGFFCWLILIVARAYCMSVLLLISFKYKEV
jgi:hypothetical protein